MEQGTVLVGKAGATIAEVVSSIQKVTAIVADISSGSAEQSQGVTQVAEAVAQMDTVTQQNAALVEESAAAELLRAVEFFGYPTRLRTPSRRLSGLCPPAWVPGASRWAARR